MVLIKGQSCQQGNAGCSTRDLQVVQIWLFRSLAVLMSFFTFLDDTDIKYADVCLGSNTAVPDTEQVQASRLASDEMSKQAVTGEGQWASAQARSFAGNLSELQASHCLRFASRTCSVLAFDVNMKHHVITHFGKTWRVL